MLHCPAGDVSVYLNMTNLRNKYKWCQYLFTNTFVHKMFLDYLWFVMRLGDSNIVIWRLFLAHLIATVKNGEIDPFVNHCSAFSSSWVSRMDCNNLELPHSQPYPDSYSSYLCPGNFLAFLWRIIPLGGPNHFAYIMLGCSNFCNWPRVANSSPGLDVFCQVIEKRLCYWVQPSKKGLLSAKVWILLVHLNQQV